MLKKANILAAVIVGAVLLAGGTILLTQLAPDDRKVDDQQRITAEADATMRQAIALGISEWMRNGFSDENKVWYSTGALPPSFDESKEGLNSIVNQKVEEYLDRLRDENEDYYIADEVEVNFAVTPPLADDLTQMVADAVEFKVGLESADFSQIEDISKPYNYPYKAWMIYSNMEMWMRENADQITQTLYSDALLGTPCQLVSGACDCQEAEITEAAKEQIRLTEDDVTPILDARVQTLSEMFAGQGITCTYEIEMMSIENTEKISWAQGDVGPEGTLAVQPREMDYGYTMERWVDEQRTRPKGDPCDGLPQADGTTTIPDGCTVRDLLTDTNGNPVMDGTVEAYVEPNPNDNEVCPDIPESEQSVTYMVNMLAMDKKLAVLMAVKCEDPGTSIETPQGLEPLAGEIRLRLAIALDCPVPTHSRDMYADESLYNQPPGTCPGGSCFPAGTMITMADGSLKAIENVQLGEEVLSYNTHSGEARAGTVLELESPVREGLYLIEFDDGSTIEVTNEHPFYTTKADGTVGWSSIIPEETYKETKTIDNVMELVVGDMVLTVDDYWTEILSIVYNEGTVQTYNLKEVSTYDNFFAGEKLVHNKCCFAAGTPVTMADGTFKAIEDVMVGDFVLTYNEETGENEAAEVYELQQPVREGLYVVAFDNGKVLEVTNDHPLMTDNGWAAIEVDAALAGYALSQIDELVVGSAVLQQDGSYASVSSIEYLAGDVQTYTLKKVAKNMNFFANGFLAHNQKMIGFIGLACNKDCPPCEGCAPAPGVSNPDPNVDSDWICVPTPNLICGPCSLCDAAGECTIPQYAGYPCFDSNGDNMMAGNAGNGGVNYADCWACDGTIDGCVMNPSNILDAILIPCDGGTTPCARCDGSGATPAAGGCTAPLSQITTCNDNTLSEDERTCMSCFAGQVGACQSDPAKEGETCDSCKTCTGGLCNAPDPGTTGECQTDTTPCMVCSDTVAGACIVDSDLDEECGACEMCGPTGGCVADTSRNGQDCGTCNVCSNGECVAGNEGQSCRSDSSGCSWACQSGDCRVTNQGSSCTRSGNSCGLSQVCSNSGCETAGSDQQMFCCGGTKCSQGSPCCSYTEQCEPCPTTG